MEAGSDSDIFDNKSQVSVGWKSAGTSDSSLLHKYSSQVWDEEVIISLSLFKRQPTTATPTEGSEVSWSVSLGENCSAAGDGLQGRDRDQ